MCLQCSTLTFSAYSCVLQGLSLKRSLAPGRVKNGLYLLQSFHPAAAPSQNNSVSSTPMNNKVASASMNICNQSSTTSVHRTLNQSITTFLSSIVSSFHNLWHKGLGHMHLFSMKHISVLTSEALHPTSVLCSICPMARQHKLPFPTSTTSTTHIFGLIHVDTWGPYIMMVSSIFTLLLLTLVGVLGPIS